MKIRAYAKINLGLNVVRKREDGYHELEMVMAPITLHDLIFINKNDSSDITIASDSMIMPTDETNIMYKAAKLMKDRYGLKEGIDMFVYKHIPMQAGLAGGSTDCAAVLRGINELFELHLDLDTLAVIGKELGADVPFCIYSKLAFVEGIGEKLTFLENKVKNPYILLVKPRRGVSTKKSFGLLDLEKEIHPNVIKIKEALEEGDYSKMVNNCANTLQAVSIEILPQIQDILDDLQKFEFDTAIMSGSGSCCFGITMNQHLALKAMKYFREQKYFSTIVQFYEEEKK